MTLTDTTSGSFVRTRRTRIHPGLRALVRETTLKKEDLVSPLFVVDGTNRKEAISGLPDNDRLSIDLLLKEVEDQAKKGIVAFALFPMIEKQLRDPFGKEALNPQGLFLETIRAFKKNFPELVLFADIALDPYTDHGHDGIIDEKGICKNDETTEILARMALLIADAGADFVSPSDMMDGRIKIIRESLDRGGFPYVGILSYAAKYASALYGPFREALKTSLSIGDKKNYQMDPANVREALLEARIDEEEGADILMVKPALAYLDVIQRLREQTMLPIAAYHVSGEYSMVMAAHEKGWLNGPAVLHEHLLSIKRAGADMIFTYAAKKMLATYTS